MQYRNMPGSDEKLSALGFGCMRLASNGKGLLSSIDTEKATVQIRHAIDNGVNYLDTAYPYHNGASESFLGEYILKDGYREKVNIATKLPCFIINKQQKIEEIFNKQLEKLNVDFIDYYLLHSLDGHTWDKMVSLDIIPFMDRIKAEKRVHRMGFSFHGTYDAFIRIVDSYDWDFCQVQYNIIDENFQAGIRGINYAASKGLGVIVMEPLKGGILAGNIPKDIQEIYSSSKSNWSPAEWALRWVLDNPNVTMVLSGMNDDKHIAENLRIASESLPNSMKEHERKTISDVRNKYLELMEVGCTGCGYCMPCPVGINIPGAFKDLNNYKMFSKASAKLSHMAYTGIITDDGKSHWTKDCIDCGKCEKACPQGIEVRREFLKVQKHLEGPCVKGLARFARLFFKKH
ncbi:MAG: aldo/keto reductase [Clostridia bacterium]|nr:aldo/keto reductase [Clostridia bacterium]MBN2882937.1 aldo/keto reductase [Clostridia bacterium]